MQAATASNPRRHKPRRVIYKSTALERTAPHLVAAASTECVSAAQSIQNANAAAEHVRSTYKQGRGTELATVDGHDDVSNAQKYERRLKMNRQSAAASRVRREAYTKALEAELVKMESVYKTAVVKLQAALARNRQLEKGQDDDIVGGDGELKQEDEECEPADVVECIEEEHEIQQEHAAIQVGDEEEANALHALAALEASDIEQFFANSAQPKLEQLVADADAALLDNKDVLNFPIPDSLPDCFLHPSLDYDLGSNEFS